MSSVFFGLFGAVPGGNQKQDGIASCFHLNHFRFGHGVPPPVPALVVGLPEGLIPSEAKGVPLGAGLTVMAVVATGAMVVFPVGAAEAVGFTLARQVQPPSSAAMTSTVPRKIRILFRFKGHTSFSSDALSLALLKRKHPTQVLPVFWLPAGPVSPVPSAASSPSAWAPAGSDEAGP